jgi:hypothetical protein
MIGSLLELMQPLIGIARTVLTTFADLVAKHNTACVPPTGGVSPLKSNSILFLVELSAYAPVPDPVIPFVFLMNNGHYSYTAIKTSPLAAVVALAEMQNLKEITSKAKEKYLKWTWATAGAKLKFDPKNDTQRYV